MINGLTRRGVPLLLVVLPDGSRSLIPSAWTDWLGSCGIDAPGEVTGSHQASPPLAPSCQCTNSRGFSRVIFVRKSRAWPSRWWKRLNLRFIQTASVWSM